MIWMAIGLVIYFAVRPAAQPVGLGESCELASW